VPLLAKSETDGLSSITPPPFRREAVEHYCRNEWARHVDDVMVRRTSWHYYHRDAQRMAEQVADWMGEIQGWSAAEKSAELARYRNFTNTALPNTNRQPELAATR
jgi:glycerol-3-phosphate dehydrogenase